MITSVTRTVPRSAVRTLVNTARVLASSTDVDTRKIKHPNARKITRQERMDQVNMSSQSKLYHINSEFGIFNDKVTKILDLGFAPGNWISYAKVKMCEVYGLDESNINDKCHFLGFDLLVGTPPPGVSSLQGNIFSKSSHKQIADRFKELEIRRKDLQKEQERPGVKAEELVDPSYFVNEQSESLVDSELEDLEKGLESLVIEEKLDYKPELILSDLSYPFLQDKGFYQNTNTKPHLRLSSNPALNQPIVNKPKSAVDMADATLVLACDLLKKGGSLVIRMACVNLDDPELDLVSDRLHKVFNQVHERQSTNADDLFFIGIDKKEDVADKVLVFGK